jgi:hypothetical protein
MSSLEAIVDDFITEHELDSDMKDPLCNLINKSMEGLFKHLYSEQFPEAEAKKEKKTSQKVLKADKLEDPSTAESEEQLKNCTTGVLNQFCRDNSLKVGGNKAEIVVRVWRFLQGTSSDEDLSNRNKPKKEKKGAEKHVCSGLSAKGAPCSVGAGADGEYKGYWFCWHHIKDADEFLKKLKPKEEEPAAEPKKEKKARASKKKEPVKEELETEDES